MSAKTLLCVALASLFATGTPAQTVAPVVTPATPAHYLPAPAFDTAAIDLKADPCTDFYKYACGNFSTLHPIPADQTSVDQFYQLYNVDTEELNGILKKYAAHDPARTPSEQKIGDFYAACMNTDLIEQKGLTPVEPLLKEIGRVSKPGLMYMAGELQRIGVNAFFSFGEGQDFKDATKQVAQVDQGGLGLPERDYYTRTGDKDKLVRQQYVAYITHMLTLSGEPADKAATEAAAILAFETKLAEASMTNVERRDPVAVYHPQTLAVFEDSIKPAPFAPFLQAIHSPVINSVVNANPGFFPALLIAVRDTDIDFLRAYLRFQLLNTYTSTLPKKFDEEHFDFYGRKLEGQPEQRARWKRCASNVDGALGEALGQVYVQQYFAGDNKAKMLQMVHDIEVAMYHDIGTLDWMSDATKARAREKLHAVAEKIGYPDHWRDYSALTVWSNDAFGNARRATAFENDRELARIGTPVDKLEWSMSPPTVNAYYNPSMNDINFPAGILQPAFYDPAADIAVNYGHIGAVIGHELTHGFDDEGKKFDGNGNLSDWWTAADTTAFEKKTGCLVKQYGRYTAVEDPKEPAMVNGKLTLGENTADNGGLVLAYLAYLDRAKASNIDPDSVPTNQPGGFTGRQRFYIAFAQNWCENSRPEAVRQQVLTDPHAPDHFRANGAIVNQPGFGAAFSCKASSPMVPKESCRVW